MQPFTEMGSLGRNRAGGAWTAEFKDLWTTQLGASIWFRMCWSEALGRARLASHLGTAGVILSSSVW